MTGPINAAHPINASNRTRRVFLVAPLATALLLSGCALTGKKPEASVSAAPRATSAAEAMKQTAPGRPANQPAQAKGGSTAFVDPMVSARPGQVTDLRRSGRSAQAELRAAKAQSQAAQASAQETALAAGMPGAPQLPGSPQMSGPPQLSGVVSQPTGIQAGRNSIFSAAAAAVAEPAPVVAANTPSSASAVSSAPASLSTDAVAYAPVRRINAVSGSMFAGGPAAATAGSGAAATAAGPQARPGIATGPTSAAAEPVAQGLW